MCMNVEIASIIFEICIVPEPATTSGTGLLLDRDTGLLSRCSSSPPVSGYSRADGLPTLASCGVSDVGLKRG